MAKISYKVCDICGKEIKRDESHHRIHSIIPVFFMDNVEDICRDCFIEMKKWVRTKRGVNNDGPSS